MKTQGLWETALGMQTGTTTFKNWGNRDICIPAWVGTVWQMKSHLLRDPKRWYSPLAKCQGPSWGTEQQKVKKRLHWVIIEALGTGCNLNSHFKRIKTGSSIDSKSTKPQRNSVWCSANRHNLRANREIKTQNRGQAYPVGVDNFSYK